MIVRAGAGLASLLLSAPATVPPMTDQNPALTLDVQDRDGMIEVRLVGLSPHTQQVSYAIELTAQSSARHRGKTTLKAGTTAVLSTLRAQAGDAGWCVTLVAEEQGRSPYTVRHGDCLADPPG
jgi:hypothetical protein